MQKYLYFIPKVLALITPCILQLVVSTHFAMSLQNYKSSPNFISVMPLQMTQCCQHCQLSLDKLKINKRRYTNLPNQYLEANFLWKCVLKRVSFGSKDCSKELKLECAYFLLKILNSGIHPYVFVLNNFFNIFRSIYRPRIEWSDPSLAFCDNRRVLVCNR